MRRYITLRSDWSINKEDESENWGRGITGKIILYSVFFFFFSSRCSGLSELCSSFNFSITIFTSRLRFPRVSLLSGFLIILFLRCVRSFLPYVYVSCEEESFAGSRHLCLFAEGASFQVPLGREPHAGMFLLFFVALIILFKLGAHKWFFLLGRPQKIP